jgi:hypothetical protein
LFQGLNIYCYYLVYTDLFKIIALKDRFSRNQFMATFRTCIWLLFIPCLLLSCVESTNSRDELIKYLDNSLENSMMRVGRSTEAILYSLEEKSKDPATSIIAQRWLAKAMMVSKYSSELSEKINILKKKLMAVSDQSKRLQRIENINEEIKELEKDLGIYNKNLMEIDPAMDSAFKGYVRFTDNDSSSIPVYPIHLLRMRISVSEAISLLKQFENNIKITENRMINFAFNKPSGPHYCIMYAPIIAISSNCSGPGDELEIIAGVGAFSSVANPEIAINDKLVSISSDGAAHYKIVTPKDAGNYSVPVSILYTDDNGQRSVFTKRIKYSVVK